MLIPDKKLTKEFISLLQGDIWQNFTLVEVSFWKAKISKRTFHQKVENMKQKLTLVLDQVNQLLNNPAQISRFLSI